MQIRINGNDKLEWRVFGRTVEIVDIVVVSQRRKGNGRDLLKRLFRIIPKEVETVYALARSNNYIAASFYASNSFRASTVLRDFYGKGEDAVLYTKLKYESGEEWPKE